MKKKLISRGLLGFPLGISLGFVITVTQSLIIGDGLYYPVVPELISAVGSEINAVVLQTVLCGLMGAGYAMASVIWELDAWSLAKQSGIYFALASAIMLPVAYVTNWMEHSVGGICRYAGVFVAIFVVVWLVQYCIWKGRITKIDHFVRKTNDGE